MRKTAYTVQLSFDIPQADKDVAEKAEKYLEYLLRLVDKAIKHFDILYDSLNESSNVPTEETVKNRTALREYRDQIIDNFNKVKKTSLECYKLLNYFNSDTEMVDLANAFTNELDELESKVNDLIKTFSDLSTEDFKNNIIKAMDEVKTQTEQLEQIINDRILDHIDNNILGKNWVSNTSNELQMTIDEKIPALIQLHNERNKAVNDILGGE